jgi:hypothetical protein
MTSANSRVTPLKKQYLADADIKTVLNFWLEAMYRPNLHHCRTPMQAQSCNNEVDPVVKRPAHKDRNKKQGRTARAFLALIADETVDGTGTVCHQTSPSTSMKTAASASDADTLWPFLAPSAMSPCMQRRTAVPWPRRSVCSGTDSVVQPILRAPLVRAYSSTRPSSYCALLACKKLTGLSGTTT